MYIHFFRDRNHVLAALLWLQDVFTQRGHLNYEPLDQFIQQCRTQLQNTPLLELTYKSYILNPRDCDFSYNNQSQINIGKIIPPYDSEDSVPISVVTPDVEVSSEGDVSVSGCGHITLLEAVDGIAWGTTGLTSWGGGSIMAEWLDNHKLVINKDMSNFYQLLINRLWQVPYVYLYTDYSVNYRT